MTSELLLEWKELKRIKYSNKFEFECIFYFFPVLLVLLTRDVNKT